MEAICGHLDLRTMTISTYYQSLFNTRLHIKFEEIWPRFFFLEKRSFKCFNGPTDVLTDGHLCG